MKMKGEADAHEETFQHAAVIPHITSAKQMTQNRRRMRTKWLLLRQTVPSQVRGCVHFFS